MALTKIVAAAALSVLVLGASATSASAHFRRWGPGPFGVVGAVIGGAATIATAPLVIVGNALSGGYEPGPRTAPGYGYPPPRAGYYYGPGPRYYYGPRRFYGRPRYYRPY